MPKGVMWRQDDLIRAVIAVGVAPLAEDPEVVGLDAPVASLAGPGVPGLPACPLMHGTGWFTANLYLTTGGSLVLLEDRHLDVEELLDTIEREGSARSRSWATRSPSPSCVPSTPSPTAGTSRACCS
jgi:fatty-acyl-CoA synthase